VFFVMLFRVNSFVSGEQWGTQGSGGTGEASASRGGGGRGGGWGSFLRGSLVSRVPRVGMFRGRVVGVRVWGELILGR